MRIVNSPRDSFYRGGAYSELHLWIKSDFTGLILSAGRGNHAKE